MNAGEREGLDANRLRNWARAYQRLMRGGLGKEAHTAAVDDFADDQGQYPYITAADVLTLLDALEAAERKITAVEEVILSVDAINDGGWNETIAGIFDGISRNLRAALAAEDTAELPPRTRTEKGDD